MKKAVLFLATDFEETEAIVTADILRRGGVELYLAGLDSEMKVKGAHNIEVLADISFAEAERETFDMLILPGGPGTSNYKNHEGLLAMVKKYNEGDKYLAAICAAPTVLGMLGVLEGKKATCYPGLEHELTGADYAGAAVEVDGRIITANGPGTSMEFGFKLVEVLAGKAISDEVRSKYMV